MIKNEIGNKCKIHRIKKFAFQKIFQCMYKISRVDSGVNLGMDPRAKEEPQNPFRFWAGPTQICENHGR